jgi:hypothetical protein
MNLRNLGHDKWELLFFITLSVTTFLTISSLSTTYAAPYYSGSVNLGMHNQAEQIPSCCLYYQDSGLTTQFQVIDIFNK